MARKARRTITNEPQPPADQNFSNIAALREILLSRRDHNPSDERYAGHYHLIETGHCSIHKASDSAYCQCPARRVYKVLTSGERPHGQCAFVFVQVD